MKPISYVLLPPSSGRPPVMAISFPLIRHILNSGFLETRNIQMVEARARYPIMQETDILVALHRDRHANLWGISLARADLVSILIV